MKNLKVKTVDFRDMSGRLLWTEPMMLSGLYKPPQTIVAECICYVVERVALADSIQHVNVRKATDEELENIKRWGSHEEVPEEVSKMLSEAK